MKKLIPFLSLFLVLCQCQESNKNPVDFKQLVNQEWIKMNPSLTKTTQSFFNDENQDTYLVFEVDFDGFGTPYTRDCDLSTLAYLDAYENNISTNKKSFRELNYLEVEITWNEKISALIWTDNELYQTHVNNWFLTDYFDCPNIISFPRLNFEKKFDVPNPRTNTQKGLAILPFDNSIEKINQTETELFTDEGTVLNGVGYDINNDQINDIFIYNEQIDEGIMYKRLFLNINGNWTCKWVDYYEDCL